MNDRSVKRILFVCMHRPDRSPGQRYRFEQYLPDLRKSGFECEISYLLNEADDRVFYAKGKVLRKALIVFKSFLKRRKELKKIKEFDLVFIYREALMTGSIFFEKYVAGSGVKMVFDFDDSIWLQNVSDGNRMFAFLKNPSKTSDLIRLSDFVFAGSPFLLQYSKTLNAKSVLMPTTIDMEMYNVRKEWKEKSVCIGWTGSITTIAHFRTLEPVLERLHAEYGDRITFKVVGDSNYYNHTLGLRGVAWSAQHEVNELLEMDIGLMPLPDDDWTRGKCACKGLQYMALGIPAVMSNVGANKDVIQHGQNGFLADNDQAFYEQLKALIESPELRRKLGDAGRETVMQFYSRQAWSERYVNWFKSLLE